MGGKFTWTPTSSLKFNVDHSETTISWLLLQFTYMQITAKGKRAEWLRQTHQKNKTKKPHNPGVLFHGGRSLLQGISYIFNAISCTCVINGPWGESFSLIQCWRLHNTEASRSRSQYYRLSQGSVLLSRPGSLLSTSFTSGQMQILSRRWITVDLHVVNFIGSVFLSERESCRRVVA